LPPAQQGKPGSKVCHQTAQALIAESATRQVCSGADPLQPSGLGGCIKSASNAHKREHLELGPGVVGSQLFENTQGDQVLPVTIAQNQ
jgi:hypothetical protein